MRPIRDMILEYSKIWPVEYQINNSFNLIGRCRSPTTIGDYKCEREREREYKPYNQLSKFSKIIIIINNEIYEEGMMGLDICCPWKECNKD